MKFIKHGLAAIIVCAFLLGTTAQANVFEFFPDIPYDADYAEAVSTLAELGILRGDENGNFNPDSTITRAEFATMMCRMLGVEDEALLITESGFSDVPPGHWASGYVTKAVELGLFSGYGDGMFGPSDTLTYEQAVAVITRILGLSDEAQNEGGYPFGYINVAERYGLTQGIDVQTGIPISRSTVAQMLWNLLKTTKGQ